MKSIVLNLLVAALVWGALACGNEDAAAYMAEARSAHARFERELTNERPDQASQSLEAFLELPVPESVNEDDARVVRHDMYYRLSDLALDRDNAQGAREWADRGLNEAVHEDVFTANLYVARGAAREALGEDVEAASDYHEALLINDALLQALLGEGDTE